jgi:hypothetical protein
MEPRIRTRFARLAAHGLLGLTLGALAACVDNTQQPYASPYAQSSANQAPQGQQMEEPRALGLWKSSFGAVKIEEDLKAGEPGSGALHGVWMYARNQQDVIGYFSGQLKGNVLQFTWQEPPAQVSGAALEGQGYLVFDQSGQRFAGRWWTTSRDRVGEWNGWRQGADPQRNPYNQPNGQPYGQPNNYGQPSPYGGQGYGNGPYAPPPPPSSYPNGY